MDVVVDLTQCSRIRSCWRCYRSLLWCVVSVLVLQWRGPGSIFVAVSESSMFCLCVLDVEEGVVGTGEENADLLVVVVRESVGGVGVSSCIELGWRCGP